MPTLYRTVVLVLLLFVGIDSKAISEPLPLPQDSTFTVDSTEFSVIFYIGHLNTDCLVDTLVGFGYYYNDVILPRCILWGKADSLTMGCVDTSLGGPPFDQYKVDTTYLQYPDWEDLEGTISLLYLNNDTVDDMLFILWGRADTGVLMHDTALFLGVFGQRGLDTFDILDVSLIDSQQQFPFFALPMIPDSNYSNPLVREITGRISYIIEPLDLVVDSSGSGNPKPLPGEWVHREHEVTLYPNPASEGLIIETKGVPAGQYIAAIYSSQGTEVARYNLVLRSEEKESQEIDTRALPSGTYILSLWGDSGVVGSYKLHVIR